jgi:hypothetical protein
MSSTLIEPQEECQLQHEPLPGDRVRTRVWSLLAAVDPRGHRLEQRGDARYPYPYLVHLTPLGPGDGVPTGEPVVVVGKHLSEHGFSFYHPKPLAFRRVIATLETVNGARLGFLLDLTWCRFTRQGWYESGGRFLDTVSSPLEAVA